jgi:hypothetical protein
MLLLLLLLLLLTAIGFLPGGSVQYQNGSRGDWLVGCGLDSTGSGQGPVIIGV